MHCRSCDSGAVFYDHHRGEFVCTRCGFVIFDRVLEPGPEWHAKNGERRERADTSSGVDFTLHDLGMGSEFTIPIEASPARRADLRRMQMLQKRSKVSGWQEKSLREALIELDKICEDLAIPKGVKGEASVIYRKARSKGITGGRDLRQVLGAVVFVVCRIRALPRTEKEVIDSLVARYGFERRSSMKTLRKISRRLSHELGLEMRRIPADEYIDKFSSQMSLSRAVIEQAHELHRRTPKRYTGTKSPILAAAVFIYLGAREVDEGLTLKKVAESLAVGISSLSQNVTRFKDILEAER